MKYDASATTGMSTDDPETRRTTVATYVPAYQKSEWVDHADRLGMTQSEFVRTMVQAGRRAFGVPAAGRTDDGSPDAGGPPPTESAAGGFEGRVREALSANGYLSWDELVASLTDDVESRLDETLQELQSTDAVAYSGRHDGYTLTDSDGR